MLGLSDHFFKKAALLVLWAGAALRVVIWLQNRSLFIDEANLIRNFAQKSYAGFFSTLSYDQFAPPLFCVAEKMLLDALGQYEQAARLLPLLAGIGALFLFERVASRWLQAPALFFAACFMALGEPFIRYATEAKQYSGDVCATLLLLWMATDQQLNVRPGHLRRVALAGPVLLWFSMPSVFVLGAIGFFYTYLIWKHGRKDLQAPLLWLALGCGLSFSTYYFAVLTRDVGNEQLQRWHVFMPLPPLNLQQWRELLQRLLDIRTSTVGYTAVSTLAFAAGLVAGVAALYRRRRADWMLLALPVVWCMIASALRQYSMVERLTLFFMPLMLILLAIGWQWVFLSGKKWLQAPLAICILAAAAGYGKPQYFVQPYRVSELREALRTVAERRQAGEQVYVQFGALPVTHYYTALAAHPIVLPEFVAGTLDPNDDLPRLHREHPEAPVWIVWDSEQTAPPLEQWFGNQTRITEKYDFKKCKAVKVVAR